MEKEIIEQFVLKAYKTEDLNIRIAESIAKGYTPVGSHQVALVVEQLQYSGMQHNRTVYDREYTQTMVKYNNSVNSLPKISDYSKSREDIFYKIIYPIYAREFLFGNNYEDFAFTVSANFILNAEQWEYIREHWEKKESILTIETKK